MSKKSIKRIGRKPRTGIDTTAVAYWFWQVERLSGLKGAAQVEIRIAHDVHGNPISTADRPHTWDRYPAGHKTPNDSTLKVSEKIAMGSTVYLKSPVWAILKGQKFDTLQIRSMVYELPLDMRRLLLENPGDRKSQFRNFDDRTARLLFKLNNFAALQALVLMRIWASQIGSHELSDRLFDLYHEMQPGLAKASDLGPFAKDIFLHLDPFFSLRQFPKSTEAFDLSMSYPMLLKLSENPLELKDTSQQKGEYPADQDAPSCQNKLSWWKHDFAIFCAMSWDRKTALFLCPFMFALAIIAEQQEEAGGSILIVVALLFSAIATDERIARYKPLAKT